MLDLIADALRDKGVDFCRIDGRSTLSQRGKALDRLRNDPACTVVLASIGAAGEGCVLVFLFFFFSFFSCAFGWFSAC